MAGARSSDELTILQQHSFLSCQRACAYWDYDFNGIQGLGFRFSGFFSLEFGFGSPFCHPTALVKHALSPSSITFVTTALPDSQLQLSKISLT
jgi:hypothetical protein